MEDIEKQLIEESLALLNEFELLDPDNEYGWTSWRIRVEHLILKQRLYDFLKDKNVVSAGFHVPEVVENVDS